MSARCERSRFWVSLRLDGSLHELEATLLDRHLGRCSTCRRFAEDTARHTHLLRARELDEGIGLDTEYAAHASARSRARLGTGAAAAAVAAIAASVVVAVGTGHPPTSGASAFAEAAPALLNDSLGAPRMPVRKPAGDSVRGQFGSLA